MATPSSVSSKKLALYEKLVATIPDLIQKGATTPYTALNGHMFSFLTKEGSLALRLPTEARNSFIEKYDTQLCEQHGTVMKEYVEVPDPLLEKTSVLSRYFKLGYDYVASLEPKPTKRKKVNSTNKNTATALRKKK